MVIKGMVISDRIVNARGVLVFVINVFNHFQRLDFRLIVHCESTNRLQINCFYRINLELIKD